MTAMALSNQRDLLVRSNINGSSKAAETIERSFAKAIVALRDQGGRNSAYIELQHALDSEVLSQESRASRQLDAAVRQIARRFLNAIPTALPMPSVSLDPDGEVSFDWIISRERMLSASLSADGRLSYAAKFGGAARKHGTEQFDDVLPEEIVRAISRLYPTR